MALRIDTQLIFADARTAPRVDANDFKQFAALRRGAEANDPATLREVARQFESLFTQMMLKSMRERQLRRSAVRQRPGRHVPGHVRRPARDADVEGQGLGLADMLVRQLSGGAGAVRRDQSAPDADAAEASRRSSARNSSRDSCRTPRRRRANSASIRAISSRRPRSKPGGARSQPGGGTVTICSASRPAPTGTAPAFRQTPRSSTQALRHATTPAFAPTGRRGKRRRLCPPDSRQPALRERAEHRQRRAGVRDALQRGGYATDPD